MQSIEYGTSGIQLAIDPSCVSEKMISYIKKGWYEDSEALTAQKIVQQNDVVLELGAGVGLISTVAWRTGKTKEIHCFEADKRLISLIKETHRINGVNNATIHNKAITANHLDLEHGYTEFNIREDFWGNSTNDTFGDPVIRKTKIESVSLENIISNIKPTLIFIDIEGAEQDIFKNTNLVNVRSISVEVHPDVTGVDGVKSVFTDLHDLGFCYDTKFSHGSVPVFSR